MENCVGRTKINEDIPLLSKIINDNSVVIYRSSEETIIGF